MAEDLVEDTPKQKGWAKDSTNGCTIQYCDNLGVDVQATNFMDYSDDSCMTEFTEGQFDRMIDQWNKYR